MAVTLWESDTLLVLFNFVETYNTVTNADCMKKKNTSKNLQLEPFLHRGKDTGGGISAVLKSNVQ